jgi:hypothetical protein
MLLIVRSEKKSFCVRKTLYSSPPIADPRAIAVDAVIMSWKKIIRYPFALFRFLYLFAESRIIIMASDWP